ncbi:hypothetical protein [Nocardia pseudovaccinii]|uniref:hypothetical protein n=1 Tax=Nocardia pseudovaccinii TaxID=189540 RepID=UPI0007A4F8F6|nr:hypothetical protein [Nocardia pseudovaccinii]
MRSTIFAADRRRKITTIGAAVLIGSSALLMTSCNDKDTKAGPTTPVSAQSTIGQGQPGANSGQSTVRTIGKTGWYEGFDITVDKATVVPDEFGGAKVLIDITYKNTTSDNKTISNNTYLQVDKEVDGGASFDSPTVPGKGSATGKVTTSVKTLHDAEHLLDTITVIYGQASDNQTKIPLKASAQVEGIAPKTLNVTGKLVQDQTTIEITGGTLAPSYTKNERDKMDLSLHIKIIGGPGIPAGGSNIFYDYFTVKTPNGQTILADIRGPINELLNTNETIDNAKNYVVFVVPSPATGTYVVTYDAKKGEGAAPNFSFTIS